MDSNSVSPLPPPEAPLAMMEVNEKTPPRSPSGHDMPPPPDEKYLKKHIWSDLFSKFLNIKDIDHLPNLIEYKRRIDDELYNMESDVQAQIRTLKNILHGR